MVVRAKTGVVDKGDRDWLLPSRPLDSFEPAYYANNTRAPWAGATHAARIVEISGWRRIVVQLSRWLAPS
jgi:hypothetical protein